jgi:uncharacterized membrane protein HdeD (DUF308 family)
MERPAPWDLAPGERDLWLGTLGRGALALLFALLAIANPWMRIRNLAHLYGAYALVDATLAFFLMDHARRRHARDREWSLGVEGIAGVVVALGSFVFPAVTPIRILGGLRGLVVGTSEVVWSRRDSASELVELGGVLACMLGALLLAWPGPATLALPWLLGLLALVSGALLFAGALTHLRRASLAAA